MIVLDTNVISEMMRPAPSSRVLAWLDAQAVADLYITSITWAELMIGLEGMPNGQRKTGLSESLQVLRTQIFGDRILPFDEAAATQYGKLMIMAQKIGQPLGMPDGQIAAIALQHGFTVVTRDISPFEAAGLKVINPWEIV